MRPMRVLSHVSRETEISSQTSALAINNTAQPDPAVLHQFAQQYWSGNDEAVGRAIERVGQLRPVLAPILKEGRIPDELSALVLVESAGRSTALSPKGARGIWQFMPDTARHYGLTVNSETDDRLDVRKSTRAAAHYLSDLYAQFDDWPLALAAYNAGAQLVRKAVSKNGARDFSRLSNQGLLPAETREYVPAVFAAATLLGGKSSSRSKPLQCSEEFPCVEWANVNAGLTTIATKTCHICFSNDTGKMEVRTVASDW
jgi:hypothetical protein